MLQLPIILAEGWDVKFYKSVRDAELDLEPVDVQANIYSGYDSEGRSLNIETDGSTVILSAAEQMPTHQKELEELLRGFLLQVGHEAKEVASLQELLEVCRPFTFEPPRSNWEVFRGLFKGPPTER